MVKSFCIKIYVGVVIYVFSIFAIVGYNATTFLALWDKTEKVFLCCGIQWMRFSSFVGDSIICFPSLWDIITSKNLRMFDKFSNFVSHKATTQKYFFHCIPQRRRFCCCIQHRKRILPILSHNAEGSIVGYNGEKNTTQKDIF